MAAGSATHGQACQSNVSTSIARLCTTPRDCLARNNAPSPYTQQSPRKDNTSTAVNPDCISVQHAVPGHVPAQVTKACRRKQPALRCPLQAAACSATSSWLASSRWPEPMAQPPLTAGAGMSLVQMPGAHNSRSAANAMLAVTRADLAALLPKCDTHSE